MSLSHDTDAKVTTADIELARKLVAQFQDDDFDCERISFELACHRYALIAERDAMRKPYEEALSSAFKEEARLRYALWRIAEGVEKRADDGSTYVEDHPDASEIARAALGGNHHGS